MIRNYAVGFLIPMGADRVLSDDGWQFYSDSRLHVGIEVLLSDNLSKRESTESYSSYEGSTIRVDVFKDENGAIENLYFRFYDNRLPELPSFLRDSEFAENVEFFVPEKAGKGSSRIFD